MADLTVFSSVLKSQVLVSKTAIRSLYDKEQNNSGCQRLKNFHALYAVWTSELSKIKTLTDFRWFLVVFPDGHDVIVDFWQSVMNLLRLEGFEANLRFQVALMAFSTIIRLLHQANSLISDFVACRKPLLQRANNWLNLKIWTRNQSFETCENSVKFYYAHSLKHRTWEKQHNLQQNWAKSTIHLILVSLYKWILPILLKILKSHEIFSGFATWRGLSKSTIVSLSSENTTRN